MFVIWTLLSHETAKRNTETKQRVTETMKQQNNDTAKHRNNKITNHRKYRNETPKHRNETSKIWKHPNETPKYHLLSVFLFLPSRNTETDSFKLNRDIIGDCRGRLVACCSLAGVLTRMLFVSDD